MAKKNIFIDCQILQTDAFDRGMGKYSLSLLSALNNNTNFTKDYQVTLILNKNLGLKKANKNALNAVMPTSKIIQLDLPINIDDNLIDKYDIAEQKLTIKLKDKAKKGDVYLILAPFFVKFPAVFPHIDYIKKVTIVYDLIPHLVWHKIRIFPDDVYFKHYQLFAQADLLLTISNAVKNDLKDILGVTSNKVTSIDGGPFLVAIKNSQPKTTKRPYILCVSAPILHKNNDRAVKAFALFNKINRNTFDLVFTSNFDNFTKQRLRIISNNIIFTGNVSNEELYWYYEGAESILFPSLTEGLGLPVLEGVMHNKPIACSRIPVLEEISSKAFYMFDPTNVTKIKDAIQQTVLKENFNFKQHYYKEILKKYNWDRSADLAYEGIKNIPDYKSPKQKKIILIYTNDPRNGSTEGKLLEKVYIQLYERYNLSVKLVGKSSLKEPAFTPYIQDLKQKNKPDFILIFGHIKIPQIKIPLVRIAVFNNKLQHFQKLKYRLKRKADLQYTVHTHKLHSEIEFDTSRYTDKKGVVVSIDDICNQIVMSLEGASRS